MNRLGWILLAALGCAVVAVFARAADAGPLDPPAAPASTDRRQISSVPVTITVPGSYVVTADLTQPVAGDAIAIDADNVTIDFNGFRLEPTGGTDGIDLVGGQSNIVIRNGSVRGRPGIGIDLLDCNHCLLEDMHVLFNGGIGVRGGANSTVRNILSSANGSDGIAVVGASANNLIVNNVTNFNTGGAGADGIDATSARNRIEGNTAISNTGIGIRVPGSDNVVVKNTARANAGGEFSIAATNSFGPTESDAALSNPWANIDQ